MGRKAPDSNVPAGPKVPADSRAPANKAPANKAPDSKAPAGRRDADLNRAHSRSPAHRRAGRNKGRPSRARVECPWDRAVHNKVPTGVLVRSKVPGSRVRVVHRAVRSKAPTIPRT